MHETIAVIFDFDDTLAPDSTSGYLNDVGLKDLQSFWKKEVAALTDADWDPVPAYLHKIIEASKTERIPKVTQASLMDYGRRHPLHDGVQGIFSRLRTVAKDANPQGLRVVSKLQRNTDEHGLNLTKTTIGSYIKYVRSSVSSTCQLSSPFTKKCGYFTTESDIVNSVWQHFGYSEPQRFPLAYIMEAADDIAYCISDLPSVFRLPRGGFHATSFSFC